MRVTIDDFRTALKGMPNADEAIFWFCNAWHSGPNSDHPELYQIMVATGYHPPRAAMQRQIQSVNLIKDDGTVKATRGEPTIEYGIEICQSLYKQYLGIPENGKLTEYILHPVWFTDVQEGDVLTNVGNICIDHLWPCRVFRQQGKLCVQCVENHSGRYAHELVPDDYGFVKGFVR